jgi:hypothetical protein
MISLMWHPTASRLTRSELSVSKVVTSHSRPELSMSNTTSQERAITSIAESQIFEVDITVSSADSTRS